MGWSFSTMFSMSAAKWSSAATATPFSSLFSTTQSCFVVSSVHVRLHACCRMCVPMNAPWSVTETICAVLM